MWNVKSGCLQLLEIWNFIDDPGKFNCQLQYNMPITKPNLVNQIKLN